MIKAKKAWTVYVLWSVSSKRTYVGISLQPSIRLLQHNGEQKGGAKATRAGRPWRLERTYGPYETRSEAQRIEHKIKKLRGRKRLEALINQD